MSPRLAASDLSVSLSPSAICGSNTAGSQIGRHRSLSKLSRSVDWYVQDTPPMGQVTSIGTVASFLLTVAFSDLRVGLTVARSPDIDLILAVTSAPVNGPPSDEMIVRSAGIWPERHPSRNFWTAESGEGCLEHATR